MKQFMKQLADQTFRPGKPNESDDELQSAERRVDQMKAATQVICRRLGTSMGSVAQSQDPTAREKRLKKIPEYTLGLALKDIVFKEDNLFKYILQECGNTEVDLAKEIAEHEVKVEQMVLAQFNTVSEQEIPSIAKAKKHLAKCNSDKDRANNLYMSLQRQNDLHSSSQASKVAQAKLELEEAETKTEQARDDLAVEMFKFLSKEINFVNLMLQYLKLQRAYHEGSLHSLTEIIPRLEKHINESPIKPMFGYPIEEHLRVTNRVIAYPIELCVCTLLELGLEEEGLLRIAGGNKRTKRLKLSLDSGMFTLPLSPQYRDVHIIAGVLKSYLRDLPDPLLTNFLYNSFVAAVTNNNSEEARLNAIWETIHKLPTVNFNNLRYLIKFLSVLTKNHSVNKMTASNIAIVIAPNLLRCDSHMGGSGINMIDTSTINCVVELLVKHADWFFKDDVEFFVSFTKEDLLPDLNEYGFTSNFGQGIYNKSFNPNVDVANEDQGMSKSMYSYSNTHDVERFTTHNQSHIRSSSHDSSSIVPVLIDNGIKRIQSNDSLTDSNAQPDSPRPLPKRKNKPAAPNPPNFMHPDKAKDQSSGKSESHTSKATNQSKDLGSNFQNAKSKNDVERPDKPPRPAVPESIKQVTGVQTINRSTYKSRQLNKLSSSRENLSGAPVSDRRSSVGNDQENATPDSSAVSLENNVPAIESIVVQHGTVGKATVGTESSQDSMTVKNSVGVMTSFLPLKVSLPTDNVQSPPKVVKPVAAPRTIIPSLKPETAPSDVDSHPEVLLRPKSMIASDGQSMPTGAKPAIPERPAMLRPSSFRISKNPSLEMLNVASDNQPVNNNSTGETTLERIHVYSVDKQQPTVINVGSGARLSDPAILSPEDSARMSAQRTISSDASSQTSASLAPKTLTSQMRKLSQSEGNILDVPPSPRPFHRLPRPQIPAPPPPTAFVSQLQPAVIESTNL